MAVAAALLPVATGRRPDGPAEPKILERIFGQNRTKQAACYTDMAAEPARQWSDEQLRGEEVAKKDIIQFLQENASETVSGSGGGWSSRAGPWTRWYSGLVLRAAAQPAAELQSLPNLSMLGPSLKTLHVWCCKLTEYYGRFIIFNAKVILPILCIENNII